jgi:hypothetical protein
MMTVSEHLYGVDATPPTRTAISLSSLRKRIKLWVTTCADYYAAASLYDELRGLSDAELHKRGLSRDTLAREVCKSCDRMAGR